MGTFKYRQDALGRWKLVDDEPVTMPLNGRYVEFAKPVNDYSALLARSFARTEVVDANKATFPYGPPVQQPLVQLFKQPEPEPLPYVHQLPQPSLLEQARRAMEPRTVTLPVVEQPTTYVLPGVPVYEREQGPRRTLIDRIRGMRTAPAKPTLPKPVQPTPRFDRRRQPLSDYLVTGRATGDVTTNVLLNGVGTRPANWAPPRDPRAAVRRILDDGIAGVPLILRSVVGATTGTTVFGLLGATPEAGKSAEARRAAAVAFLFTWIEAMCGEAGRRIVAALKAFTDAELEPLALALMREVTKGV